MIKKYRKKPVVIEAIQIKDMTMVDVRSFLGISNMKNIKQDFNKNIIISFDIPTLEGDMKASYGDYIIKGINGEFYPCKPDIFKKTYEEVE